MNARDKKLVSVRPDEWGFYNPDEAGFAAVIKRIGTRGRVTARKVVPAVSVSAREDSHGERRRDLAVAVSGREGGPVAPVTPVASAAPSEAAPRKRKPRTRIQTPKAS